MEKWDFMIGYEQTDNCPQCGSYLLHALSSSIKEDQANAPWSRTWICFPCRASFPPTPSNHKAWERMWEVTKERPIPSFVDASEGINAETYFEALQTAIQLGRKKHAFALLDVIIAVFKSVEDTKGQLRSSVGDYCDDGIEEKRRSEAWVAGYNTACQEVRDVLRWQDDKFRGILRNIPTPWRH